MTVDPEAGNRMKRGGIWLASALMTLPVLLSVALALSPLARVHFDLGGVEYVAAGNASRWSGLSHRAQGFSRYRAGTFGHVWLLRLGEWFWLLKLEPE